MAPAIAQGIPVHRNIRQVSRSLSSTFSSLPNRAADVAEPSLVSLFALVISKGSSLSARATSAFMEAFRTSPEARAATAPLAPLTIHKRQNQIFSIPSSYKGLNAGPAPGAVVGIILGTIAGFIICLYLLLYAFQYQLGGGEVVTEEVITTSQRRSRRSSRHTVMSERQPAPASRRETIVIEETTHRRPASPDEVIVEEHEDDIVEVIEDPSSISSRTPPPAKPSRRESRRSGYRTVDPAELGGGRDRFKGIGRR